MSYGAPPPANLPPHQQMPMQGMPHPGMQQPVQAYAPQQQQPPNYPQQQAAPPGPAANTGAPVLAAFYGGQRFVVNKDRFILGRGKQSSDLTIKDPNVSRQHAMVEFLNGQFYMVDMGSTNGVEYNGQRIARKVIAEGDLYRICDHEIRFSYR